MSNLKKKFKCSECDGEIPIILNESTDETMPASVCFHCDAVNSAIEILIKENTDDSKTLLCD